MQSTPKCFQLSLTTVVCVVFSLTLQKPSSFQTCQCMKTLDMHHVKELRTCLHISPLQKVFRCLIKMWSVQSHWSGYVCWWQSVCICAWWNNAFAWVSGVMKGRGDSSCPGLPSNFRCSLPNVTYFNCQITVKNAKLYWSSLLKLAVLFWIAAVLVWLILTQTN